MESVNIPIDKVQIPESSLRQVISEDNLGGLSSSISEVGLLQPILVREISGQFEIVAGMRRLAAAQQAGYESIAAVVLAADIDTLQVQLIENLQREDLNPVERAEAVQAFMNLHQLSKAAAAKRLGVPRTTLTDWLDLLEVPNRFREAIIDNFKGGDSPLTPSHVSEALAAAKVLKGPHLAEALLNAVLKHKLSKAETREVARIIRKHRDTSIEVAITAIRGEYCAETDEQVSGDDLSYLPHEENMQALVLNLARSTRALERMNHLSGRFVEKEAVAQLVQQYMEIKDLSERALSRLRMEEPELLDQIQREMQFRQAGRRAARTRRRNQVS